MAVTHARGIFGQVAAAIAARLDELQQPVRAGAEHDVRIAAAAPAHPGHGDDRARVQRRPVWNADGAGRGLPSPSKDKR